MHNVCIIIPLFIYMFDIKHTVVFFIKFKIYDICHNLRIVQFDLQIVIALQLKNKQSQQLNIQFIEAIVFLLYRKLLTKSNTFL